MKTVGKIATGFLVIVVLAALGWLIGAGVQGKTLKDTVPEQKVETEIDQGNTETDGTETDGEEQEPEATQVAYDAERNTLFVG